MSGAGGTAAESISTSGTRRSRLAPMHFLEDWALALTLFLLMTLPLAEIALRKFLHTGIAGVSSIIQHVTLVSGILGAVVAARERRLLSLSTLGSLVGGPLKSASAIFSSVCGAVVSLSLGIASYQFVEAERLSGKILSYGIPIWTIQAILPIGFCSIALRLLWQATDAWTGRIVAAFFATGTIVAISYSPFSPDRIVVPALVALLAATVLGIPVFATMGGVALVMFWGRDIPIASVTIDHYSLVTNPSIATIPLFTLAGYFLAEGGAPRRLVRVFRALFGQFAGGSAIVTALACAFFTTFTGGSGVTIVAIGGLLMPVLLTDKYSEKSALGLVTGAGSLGLLFPPCLPLILYAIVARIPIDNMFLGGLIPGVIMVAAVIWWGIHEGRAKSVVRQPFAFAEAKTALWEAKWELLLPVVTFIALFSGLATPVEASAVTALYAFFAEAVIYRDLSFNVGLRRVMVECGLLVGGVLMILGIALGLTNYLVDAEITARAVEWTTHTIHSRWMFLLVLNLFLLVVGCLMDIYSAIIIQVPLLIPIGQAFNVDPVHLGIIFLANLELGYLTPPVGLNLFLSSYRFGKPVPEVLRAVAPIVAVLFIGVLLITYVPWFTTAMPQWFGHAN